MIDIVFLTVNGETSNCGNVTNVIAITEHCNIRYNIYSYIYRKGRSDWNSMGDGSENSCVALTRTRLKRERRERERGKKKKSRKI